MIKYLENNDLKSEIKDKKVLIDFYADWCNPCKMLGTTLEEITEIDIIKVNVDKFPDIAREYGIMSIPAVYIYNNNEVINKFVGLKSKEEIESIIKG